MKKVLVTGGAGYIGSHTCKLLSQRGYLPVVIDSLEHGYREFVKWGPFYQENISNSEAIRKIISSEQIKEIIHFAAYAYVGESVNKPLKYYQNNVSGTLSLLSAAEKSGIESIVFSSTCATYGIPQQLPITEESSQVPINPYGQTKLQVEQILKDVCHGNCKIKSVALRYFNACGADLDGQIGESHNPETHLIPLVIRAAIDNKTPVTIMGTDYETPDGTCIRDYIHVVDLADAHVKALEYLKKTDKKFSAFNLGTGLGQSVLDIVRGVEKVCGIKPATILGNRRPGDPPILVADGSKAKNILGWRPQYSDLNTILQTAYNWEKRSV